MNQILPCRWYYKGTNVCCGQSKSRVKNIKVSVLKWFLKFCCKPLKCDLFIFFDLLSSWDQVIWGRNVKRRKLKCVSSCHTWRKPRHFPERHPPRLWMLSAAFSGTETRLSEGCHGASCRFAASPHSPLLPTQGSADVPLRHISPGSNGLSWYPDASCFRSHLEILGKILALWNPSGFGRVSLIFLGHWPQWQERCEFTSTEVLRTRPSLATSR